MATNHIPHRPDPTPLDLDDAARRFLVDALLSDMPDDDPATLAAELAADGAPLAARVPDYSAVPEMPWVAYVALPDDEAWTRDAPLSEAFSWIEGPYRADVALRPTQGRVYRFVGDSPAEAITEAQAFLVADVRGVRRPRIASGYAVRLVTADRDGVHLIGADAEDDDAVDAVCRVTVHAEDDLAAEAAASRVVGR